MEKLEISYENKFFADVLRLYKDSFPADERREENDFLDVARNCHQFSIHAFTEDDAFVGFLTSWEWDDFRYGEHFAVLPEKRGEGIGSRALKLFLDSSNKPLIIEVEPPTDKIARRRIGFYERNGLVLRSDVDYIQPPYSPEKSALPLLLMTYGDVAITTGDSHICRLHRDVYRTNE